MSGNGRVIKNRLIIEITTSPGHAKNVRCHNYNKKKSTENLNILKENINIEIT
jgi:hypothetical protein